MDERPRLFHNLCRYLSDFYTGTKLHCSIAEAQVAQGCYAAVTRTGSKLSDREPDSRAVYLANLSTVVGICGLVVVSDS